MKKVRLFNVLLFIFSIALLQSCAKEGCTDVDAVNYDSYADKNDGSYPPIIIKAYLLSYVHQSALVLFSCDKWRLFAAWDVVWIQLKTVNMMTNILFIW